MRELFIINQDYKAIVDDEDFERLSKFRWYSNENKNIKRSTWKRRTKDISLPEEIMQTPRTLYDHIDNNPLNNQKSNLRKCTYKQNCYNTIKRKNTRSQYKGVSWNCGRNKWLASIAKDYTSYYLGYYESEIEAALAYNIKAKELFGEFARLNNITYDSIQETDARRILNAIIRRMH